jgi:hypothetical protein
MRGHAPPEVTVLSTALRVLQPLLQALLLGLLAVGLNLPWPIDAQARAALPLLVLPVVHWTAFRAPGLLPAPVALAAGLLADVVGDTPLGYWPLMYLAVLACGRAMRHLFGSTGIAAALAALPVYAGVALGLALAVPALFTLAWPDPAPAIAGIGLGIVIESLLILGGALLARGPLGVRHAIAAPGER